MPEDENREIKTILVEERRVPVEAQDEELSQYRARRSAMVEETAVLDHQLSEAYGVLSQSSQDRIQDAFTRYYYQEIDKHALIDVCRLAGLSEDGIAAFQASTSNAEHMEEVEPHLLELEYNDVQKRAARLIDSIDWEGLEAYFIAQKNKNVDEGGEEGLGSSMSSFVSFQLAVLTEYKNRYSQPLDRDLDSLDSVALSARAITSIEEALAKANLIKSTQKKEANENQEDISMEKGLDDTTYFLKLTKDIERYSIMFRSRVLSVQLTDLYSLSENRDIIAQAIEKGHELPQPLLSVLTSKSRETILKYWRSFEEGQELEQNIDISTPEILDKLSFEGFESIDGLEQIVSVDNVREWLSELPSVFFTKIKAIKCTNEIDEIGRRLRETETIDPNQKTADTTGVFNSKFSKEGHFTEGDIEIMVASCVNPNISLPARSTLIEAFKNAAVHEVFHRVLYGLPFERMEDWVNIHADGVNVTSYVKETRDETDAPYRAIREDFCESAMQLVNNPGVLYRKSESRFHYMLGLISNYLPAEQKDQYVKDKIHEAIMYNQFVDDLEALEKSSKNKAISSII